MGELKELEKLRKLKGISWEKLASNLPINGNSLRIAFSRESVDEVYLDEIKKTLNAKDEPTIAYTSKVPITLDESLFSNKDNLARLVRFLHKNHHELMKDELFALYYKFIESEIIKEKSITNLELKKEELKQVVAEVMRKNEKS